MGSSTWDDAPAAADNSWKADGAAGADAGWEPTDQPNGAFHISDENVSKHAGGIFGGDDAPHDGGCRVCGADGHFARDCPDKPPNSGECFNCGEVGHNKADCPNPRVEREFTGTCNSCGVEGHRAADCPDRGPQVCKLCKGEGHKAAECDVNRAHAMFNQLSVKELTDSEAWAAIEKADKEKDIDDIKLAIFSYARVYPELTIQELEAVFRSAKMNIHLIAKEQMISEAYTIVNFQGKIDQKYVVSFQWSDKPKRAKFAEGWPSSAEENVQRLAEAGFAVDSLVPKCANCNEYGHTRNNCEQDKNEAAKVAITCANCSEEGHRARDCTNPRKSGKKGCRNCGSEDHIAKDCDQPRDLSDVECKECGQMGHFSRDCPDQVCRNCNQKGHSSKGCENERVIMCRNCDQEGHISKECPEPRNMAKVQCRNCDEFGHTGRDCLKPTDWSRVECSTCHEKGHSYKRCPDKDAVEAGGAGGSGGWEDGAGGDAGAGASSGGGGGWEDSAAASGGDGGDGDSGWGAGAAASSGGGW